MREFAVARQPILDAQLHVVGYELLFRAPGARTANVVDAQAATSSVIVDSFMEIGLDELVGEHVAYLNVSRDFLMSVRPLPLPPGRVVLELLENQQIDEDLLGVLRELVADGFTLALDDFRYTPEAEPLLELARIVKLDVLALEEEELLEQVALLRRRRPRLSLLGEKVETRADFERCRVLGFDAFQGYFFARPSLTHGRGVPTQCLGALSAVSSLNAVEDFDSLEQIITRDVGLSLRLLRYANSAYVFLPRRVGSVREALIMLGARQVRRWATVVVLAGTSDAPHELLVTGLVRARMCQLLCGAGDDQTRRSLLHRRTVLGRRRARRCARWTTCWPRCPSARTSPRPSSSATGRSATCSRRSSRTSAGTSRRSPRAASYPRARRSTRRIARRSAGPTAPRACSADRRRAPLLPCPGVRAEESRRRGGRLLGSVLPHEVTDAGDDVQFRSGEGAVEALGHRHAGERSSAPQSTSAGTSSAARRGSYGTSLSKSPDR